MDFRQQFYNQPLIKKIQYIRQQSIPEKLLPFFFSSAFLSWHLPNSCIFKVSGKAGRKERRKQIKKKKWLAAACLISTACKKCLIKKKTLNKEENSPSFQSLAFLSASVQQKLQSAISKKLFCRNIVSFILLNASFFINQFLHEKNILYLSSPLFFKIRVNL